MSNRRDQQPLGRFDSISKGTDGANVPDDFTIPSLGIRDIDKALFDYFELKLKLQVSVRNKTRIVPIVFAGGDRYALVKNNTPIRDKSGAVITPIISIRRTSVSMGATPALAIGSDIGDIIVRRRLDASDATHQRLRNRFGLKNQSNVAVTALTGSGRLSTRRSIGGSRLAAALTAIPDDNIYEILTVPMPNPVTLKYTVTFWTDLQGEMNQLIDRFIATADPGTLITNIRLDTDKGYWFVGYVDNDISMDDNFTDYSSTKKLVKTSMTIDVPAYTLAHAAPGDPSPVRRYTSAVDFTFDVAETRANVESTAVQTPMIGPDSTKFVLTDVDDVQIDGRIPGTETGEIVTKTANDRYAAVQYVTKKGERVGRISDITFLDKLTNS